MSYRAEVYSVFIASPSDVGEERRIIKDIIYEWNAVNSNSKGVVLLPLGWETHSVPDMSKSAQKIINEQILKKADILVGVFWSKVGTPTKDYPSGTIEEIREHINAGKPTMVYFSKVALPQNDLDPAQWKEVNKFKDFCKTVGLYCEYDNVSAFEKIFRNHLSIKMNEYSNVANAVDDYEDEIPDIADSLINAKKYLLRFHEAISYAEQKEIDRVSAKLSTVFRKIYIYKESHEQTIMSKSCKNIFDEIIENYNDYVSIVQSIIPLLNTKKDSREFENIQNSINLKQRKLLDLCDKGFQYSKRIIVE